MNGHQILVTSHPKPFGVLRPWIVNQTGADPAISSGLVVFATKLGGLSASAHDQQIRRDDWVSRRQWTTNVKRGLVSGAIILRPPMVEWKRPSRAAMMWLVRSDWPLLFPGEAPATAIGV